MGLKFFCIFFWNPNAGSIELQSPAAITPMAKPKKQHPMTLQEAISEIIQHPANTNHTGLSLCPEVGWRLTFTPSDRGEGDVMVLAKESLQEWADGHEWTELQYALAADWIRDNLGEWIRHEENYTKLMEVAL
jgi:hypothetical protein